MIEIERPNIITVDLSEDGKHGTFVIEPLERGYGITLGNSLRRVLLSSLPGVAATSIKIEGVLHEISTVPGVQEDVTEIVLNIKGVVAKLYTQSPKTVFIKTRTGGEITAGDIVCDSDIEILNPEHHIATVEEGAEFYMEITFDHGRGYVSSDKNKQLGTSVIGLIYTDSIYTPVYNVNYKDALWDVMGGFSMQLFRCNHWGKVTYIADEALEKKYFTDGRYKYYDSDANKNDWSWFFKANRKFGNGWNWFLDMQMRYVNYNTDGLNDHFEQGADGNYKNQSIDINENYFFVNPKAGISYDANGHKAYASIAYANREPERNNFTDNIGYGNPSPERLLDLEWGYQYQGENWFAGVNFYYMKYVNQFVMTGEKSDIGESLTRNIKDSYRLGAEVSAGWSPLSWLSLEGNAALSRNRLKNFKECVESWDGPAVWNTYKSSTIAFSPSAILNGFVDVHFAGFHATWHTNFVSKQYLDNTESSERSLPCYSQTNVNASYTFNFAKRVLGLKQVVLGADFNNIFDRHYAASGYLYYDWYNNNKRNSTVAYIPMAGFNCLGTVTLKF